nr:F-box/kelch-repeat protein At3g18720-like [Aegilops tauschii subsp. strangulata]
MPDSVLLAIVALAVVSAWMAFSLARRNQPSMQVALPPSSYAPVVHAASRATENDAQQRNSADDDYWSGLPDDLLFTIMSSLDVPSLRRAGAVCRSWRAAHNAFCLPALERASCLFYACEEYGPNDAALYSIATGSTFRVPFPGPPHEKRGFTFACHGGWLFTTDEVGDPYLLNPVTGVQAALPPVKTIYKNHEFYDDGGKHVHPADPEDGIMLPYVF